MNSTEYKNYGLIGGNVQIQAYIYMACKVISPTTVENAKLLLAETIAVESKNGQVADNSLTYGEGLTQFDKPTFIDVKKTFSDIKHVELLKRIKTFLNVDILTAEYEDLRKSPMLSIVMARLLYLRVPESIPDTDFGRWAYYKRWFNSSLGATTESKYMNAKKFSVYKV